ncbi:hypothetical protein NM688_g8795 [Phlebia brevispora]|uniref:Uncharacterized protein n=1 Tax=Phlebia brevispora TaxID=194682 RepID=A0ACC1RS92_9APHY|nr:hypothetical protein NM688_g8795 [Phlebia brevispora]
MERYRSSIPDDGFPFFLGLYADKTELASFGDQKAYPVVAQWCALPHLVRNSKGLGAGRVIGFLPVIAKNAREDRKTGYTTFKNVVWHEGVWEMLKELAQASHLGRKHKCGDDVVRTLYFLILILAADYEEQCTMALVRGLKSLFPCVICDAPAGRLWDVTEPWSIRDPEKVKAIIQDPMLNITQKNEMTKHYGIRPTENLFWKFFNCNPYEALSFDRLHAFHGGLFGKHFLPMLQDLLAEISREAQGKVDDQVALIPRFSGLTHFKSVSQIKLTDGTKFEDLSKVKSSVIIHVSHNVIDEKTCPEGLQLLKTIRAYQVLDTWLSFDLHTEETVAEIEKSIARLEVETKALAKFYPDKVWQFIKNHSYSHSARDIRKKGVTRNYNTKPNEKLHGRLKEIYQTQTNFKDVKKQITKLEHRSLIVSGIRDQWDEYQAYQKSLSAKKEDRVNPYRFGDHLLGSRQRPTTVSELEALHPRDPAFHRFHIRLANFLTIFLLTLGKPLPHGQGVKLSRSHEITECHSIKLLFESKVNWRDQQQILHVADDFYGSRRRDSVLVRSDNGTFFVANLEFVFTCKLENSDEVYPLALIHPLDAPIGSPRRKDRALELIRLRATKREKSQLVRSQECLKKVSEVLQAPVPLAWDGHMAVPVSTQVASVTRYEVIVQRAHVGRFTHPQQLLCSLSSYLQAQSILWLRGSYKVTDLNSSSPPLALFIAYALQRTQLHHFATFTALYLLLHLKSRFPAVRRSSGPLMLPSKAICDDTYSNKSWSIVGQEIFALREINQMEWEMYSYLEWQLNIDPQELKEFDFKVR